MVRFLLNAMAGLTTSVFDSWNGTPILDYLQRTVRDPNVSLTAMTDESTSPNDPDARPESLIAIKEKDLVGYTFQSIFLSPFGAHDEEMPLNEERLSRHFDSIFYATSLAVDWFLVVNAFCALIQFCLYAHLDTHLCIVFRLSTLLCHFGVIV